MSDFMSKLASQSGVKTELAEKGMGALLATLEQHAGKDVFSKISGSLPEAQGLLSTFQNAARNESSGGTLSTLAGLAGGLIGGGKTDAITTLISQFSSAGFSLDSAKAFLPIALKLLKDNVSPDTAAMVEKGIPGISAFLGGSDAGDLLGKAKGLFGQSK